MGNIKLISSGRLTEKQARLNMEKCAEFLARMIQKYGDSVLGEIEPEKMDDGRIIRQIDLAFPVYYESCEGDEIRLLNENTVETVVLLQRTNM